MESISNTPPAAATGNKRAAYRESEMPQTPATVSLLNGIPHGVVLLDQGLRVRVMNRFLEALTGYSSGEARGVKGEFVIRGSRNFKELFPHERLLAGETHSLEIGRASCRERVCLYV